MSLTRNHWISGAVLFITFVIEAWEQVGLVYVSPGIEANFHIGASALGWALSGVALGMVPGTLMWGSLIDRIGRRGVTIYSLLLYAVLALGAGMAPNFVLFLTLRILSGVAFGGVYAVTFPYFLELLPTKTRGPAAVGLSIGFPVGTLLCVAVSRYLGVYSWRWVAIVAALAGLWALAVRIWTPESPYWLAARGRHHDAAKVLRHLGANIPADMTFRVDPSSHPGSIKDLFAPAIRRPVALLLLVSFTFSWGYWGLQTWLPTLLAGKGMELSSTLTFVAISQLVAVPGYLSAAILTRRYGRRPVFIVYALASAIGSAIFAMAHSTVQLYVGNFTLAFFSLGAWGIWNTWSGEILPTSVRGIGYSWSTGAVLLANTLAVPAVGALMDHGFGTGPTVLFITFFLLVSLVGVIPLPETEGHELV